MSTTASSGKVIGIDLGTTNSCVSICEGADVQVIPGSDGERTTPSVVAYADDRVLVGTAAKRQAVTNAKGTLYAIKRLIGRRFQDKVVRQDMGRMPYEIVEATNGDAWCKVGDKTVAPGQVSAEVLRKLKEAAEAYLGESVTNAVITVPAYFDDAQRQATKDAGRIAGLNVLRTINEPTAAALAYGIDKLKKDSKIVVYDLGGGTFDVSVIEIAIVDGEHQFEVHSTAGNTFLGGEDFDQRIINWIADEFKKEQGIDLQSDPIAMQRLKEAAEVAKCELSSGDLSDINLPFISADQSGPKHLQMRLTRSKLEGLVNDLVEKTLEPIKQALSDAKMTVGDIDEVLMVGGQTRMPLVRAAVERFFECRPRQDVDPDLAVAMGAAVQGSVLSGERKDVLLLDVTPLSLGIETLGGVMTPLIERNTTIPTSKSKVFSTAEDNQESVTVHVLQGERAQATGNKSLGNFTLGNISRAPRGAPQIEVKFSIDANGILKVTATDKETSKEQFIEIKNASGLSEDEVERMRTDAESNADADRRFEELVRLRNDADTLVHEMRRAITEFDTKIDKDLRDRATKIANDLAAMATSDEPNLEQMQSMMEEARSVSEEIVEIASRSQQGNGTPPKDGGGSDSGKDDAVDADFKEVK